MTICSQELAPPGGTSAYRAGCRGGVQADREFCRAHARHNGAARDAAAGRIVSELDDLSGKEDKMMVELSHRAPTPFAVGKPSGGLIKQDHVRKEADTWPRNA